MSKDKIEVSMNVYDIPIIIETLEKAEDTIKKLQQENQQLKKQKDDVVEYIKKETKEFHFENDKLIDILRMLGEIGEENIN